MNMMLKARYHNSTLHSLRAQTSNVLFNVLNLVFKQYELKKLVACGTVQ